MKSREWIAPEYPEDHQIYFNQFEVAGAFYRKEDVRQLLRLKDPYLRLKAEPSNPHDQNAVQVLGCGKWWFWEKQLHIGYLPADFAALIAKKKDSLSLLFPRLRMIEDGEFLRVVMELTGPKGRKKAFFS